MGIINTYNLTRFDGELSNRDRAWLESESLDPWHLPIVADEAIAKAETWASVYKNDKIDFATRVKQVVEPVSNEELNNTSADIYYVEKTLSLKSTWKSDYVERYKREPQIGDIAIYKSETSDNKVTESYSVVEGFKEGLMLISEGVKGENGLSEIYRTIPQDSLEKFEFISIEANKKAILDKQKEIKQVGSKHEESNKSIIQIIKDSFSKK